MTLDSKPGVRQIGNYDLLELIAEGGMGAVYKGKSRATGDVVAIKIVPSETARNQLLLKRFEQEFKAASLIDHPNVVKGLDYCGTGPTPFLVMEYVDGESLGQRVERDGAIPEAEAVQLISQVCEGLHRAHKQGLIHRDVKPDNILVTADGVAKITDLGLVKDIEGEMNLTQTGRGLGTPHFMAPEQFRQAKNADIRCDVYSLGATLYAIVTGVTPFSRTTPLDCWMKKTKNDFPEPRAILPEISERVNWAICRAMNADPTQRPASCREFMEDLIGTGWRATGSGAVNTANADPTQSAPVDLWYMVYRDDKGQSHTVKGTTESIRRNIVAGTLGDINFVVLSRTKTGQFVPIRSVPEFRDLIFASPSSSHPALTAAAAAPSPSGQRAGLAGAAPAAPQPQPQSSGRMPGLPTPALKTPLPSNTPSPSEPTAFHPASHATTPVSRDPTQRITNPARKPADEPKTGFDWAPVLLIVIAILSGAAGLLLFAK